MLPALATNYLVLIVSTITQLLLVPVLVYWLGDQSYGLWIFAGAILSNLNLGTGSAQNSVVKRVAEVSGTGDHVALEQVVSTGLALYAALAALVFAATLALLRLLPLITPAALDSENAALLPPLILLLGGRMALGIVLQLFGNLLYARRRIEQRQTGLLLSTLVTFLLSLGVVLTGGGVIELAWAQIVGYLVDPIWCWYTVRRIFGGCGIRIARVNRIELFGMLGFGGWLVITATTNLLVRNIPVLILGWLAGMAAVTLYSTNGKLWELGRMLLVKIVGVVWPRVSERIGAEDRPGMLYQVRLMAVPTVALAATGCAAIGVMAQECIVAWVGSPLWGGYVMAAAFAALTFVRVSQIVAYATMLGAGRVKGMALAGLAESGALFVTVGIGAWYFGPAGAAVGLLMAALLTTAWAWPMLLGRFLRRRTRELFVRTLRIGVVGGGTSLVVALGARWTVAIEGLGSALLGAGIAVAAGLIACWWLAFTPGDRELFLGPLRRYRRLLRGTAVSHRPESPGSET